MKRILFFFFLLLVFQACEKDENSSLNELGIETDRSFFVLNEGAFGQGNASLCVMEASEDKICGAFSSINGNQLGDVLQYGSIINDHLYLVVNGSDIIWNIDLPSLEVEESITGMGSPRQILPIDENKAYVSDFTSNRVHILNLESNQVSGSIPFNGWSEDMVLFEEEVWVSNPEIFGGSKTEFVYIIDSDADSIVDSVNIGRNPVAIEVDGDGSIWALASGNPFEGDTARLVNIDPLSRTITKTYELPPAYFGKLALNPGQNTLAIMLDEVFLLDINSGEIDGVETLEQAVMAPYGISFDPRFNNSLWVTDARDYISAGHIMRYDISTDEIVEDHEVGINPNGLVFY